MATVATRPARLSAAITMELVRPSAEMFNFFQQFGRPIDTFLKPPPPELQRRRHGAVECGESGFAEHLAKARDLHALSWLALASFQLLEPRG